MITGSIALSVYATPRMTRNVDLIVDFQAEDAGRITRLFEKDCYIDHEAVRQASVERGMFNIIHDQWIIKADFTLLKDEPYRQLEFKRQREIDIDGFSIYVVSPEDLILSKLCWVKDSESEVQERDVRDIIRSVEALDWPYLEKWAKELNISNLLERARSS